jgi:membrane protease YdiL (CAAX protease family)
MINKRAKKRISILLVFAFFLSTFVLINAQEFVMAAFIYIIMGGLSLFLYGQWGRLGKLGDLEGIDDNFVKDGLVGLFLGIGTIILGSFIGFIGAIGIPPVQSIAGTLGRFIIIVPVASIFEEVFFRDLEMDFLDSKLKLPKWISLIIMGISFSLFHLAAYGESLRAASGSFTSAAIMGVVFGIVTEKQNSLAGSIVYHMVLNAYIGFISAAIIIG